MKYSFLSTCANIPGQFQMKQTNHVKPVFSYSLNYVSTWQLFIFKESTEGKLGTRQHDKCLKNVIYYSAMCQ